MDDVHEHNELEFARNIINMTFRALSTTLDGVRLDDDDDDEMLSRRKQALARVSSGVWPEIPYNALIATAFFSEQRRIEPAPHARPFTGPLYSGKPFNLLSQGEQLWQNVMRQEACSLALKYCLERSNLDILIGTDSFSTQKPLIRYGV